MIIAGLQRFSLIEYPEKTSAIIFTRGCLFRCHFCHNPELVDPSQFDTQNLSEENVLAFLESRKKQLDAVVITGGEPTLQKGLSEFISKIKNLGFLVKLDTTGINPELLQDLIDKNLIDYVAMDIKAPLDKYEKVIAIKFDIAKIKKSISILLSNHIPYEFRSTVVDGLHSEEDILDMAKSIQGADLYFLQSFNNKKTLNPAYQDKKSFSNDLLKKLQLEALNYVKKCQIR